jgi:hypothetical protein
MNFTFNGMDMNPPKPKYTDQEYEDLLDTKAELYVHNADDMDLIELAMESGLTEAMADWVRDMHLETLIENRKKHYEEFGINED